MWAYRAWVLISIGSLNLGHGKCARLGAIVKAARMKDDQ